MWQNTAPHVVFVGLDAHLFGDRHRRCLGVTRQQHRCHSHLAQHLDRFSRCSFRCIRDHAHRARLAAPCRNDGSVALLARVRQSLAENRGNDDEFALQKSFLADDHRNSVDGSPCTHAGERGEIVDSRQITEFTQRTAGDRLGNRVLARVFDGTDQPKRVTPLDSVGAHNLAQLHHTGRHGAGLVEHHRVDTPRALQNVDALDDNSHLCRATASHHQCGGGRKAERTRTRDDQHRHGGGERLRTVSIDDQPTEKCDHRSEENGRNEPSADPVRKLLHGSLGCLRLAYQLGHLRKRRVGSDPGGTDHDTAGEIDRRTRHRIVDGDVDGNTLACQHRHVD